MEVVMGNLRLVVALVMVLVVMMIGMLLLDLAVSQAQAQDAAPSVGAILGSTVVVWPQGYHPALVLSYKAQPDGELWGNVFLCQADDDPTTYRTCQPGVVQGTEG